MTDVSVARAWAPRTTAFRARHMTDGAVQSTQATALYKIATKGLATLRIITNQETLVSGVIQAAARAPGQIAKAWHVMMVTSAHVVTRVAVASAVPPHSRVIPGANTVMALPAV